MARIRTIKPDFFRHELLQDLEQKNPNLHPMLLFSALWGHCDKQGVFEWRPKMLALDILPFIWSGSTGEALGLSLVLLRENGLVLHYEKDGKEYGYIPTFEDHQRINGKEAQEASRFPQLCEMQALSIEGSNREATGKQLGSNGEAVETTGREGKGREKEEEGNGLLCPKNSFSDSDMEFAKWMLSKIKSLGKAKTTNLKTWADDIRKMRDLDRISYEEMEKVFLWAHNDDFWVANILSPAKLRAKFQQLSIKANQQQKKPVGFRERVNAGAVDDFVNG